jgi:hypothetical protein
MPLWICIFCDRLMDFWLTASPSDFGRVWILVVVFGWMVARSQR